MNAEINIAEEITFAEEMIAELDADIERYELIGWSQSRDEMARERAWWRDRITFLRAA